jgi:uncharacterized delta-60 repeat protein
VEYHQPSIESIMANLTSTSTADGGKIISVGGSAYSVIMQSDGKILVAGRATMSIYQAWGQIVRYNIDGSLDTTFSGDGVFNCSDVVSPDGMAWAWNKFSDSIALQSDGKIVVVGSYAMAGILARINADGSIDDDSIAGNYPFSGSGALSTPSYQNHSVAIQSDGKILVLGQSKEYGPLYDFVLMRYNPDGSLDASFSFDGKLTTDFESTSDSGRSLAVQSDGKILVAGNTHESGGHAVFALARYNTDGSPDTSFSGDGKLTTDFGGDTTAWLCCVVTQSDGKILAVGQHADSMDNDWHFVLVRYNINGSLDTSFSGDGSLIFRKFSLTTSWDATNDLTVQPDGKILVAGSMDNDFALVRFNTDGSLDTTFSGDGIVTTDFGDSSDQATCVTVQSNGKIVVAGYKIGGTVLIARYNTDGSLDTSFTGIADTTAPTVNTFTPADGVTGVAVDHNIVFDFSESIQRGTGTITIHSGSADGPVVESYNAATSTNLTLSGSTLTINPTADLVNSNHYYVTFSAGSVKDLAGNSYAGTTSYDFTTEAPILTPMLRNGISVMPERYSGPATAAGGALIHFQYIGDSSGEIIIGTPYNDFINSGAGDDAVDAKEGNDVIDGGTGSNFLTGGGGTDIFFSDGRGGVTTWSTITDWQAGEQLSVWGWTPGTSKIIAWVQAGAAGYEGLTMHADLNGDGAIDTSVTFTGITSQSQLPTPLEFEGVLWFT